MRADIDASPTPPRAPLTLPFALLGLAGAWFTAKVFGISLDAPFSWILLVVTPFVAAGLGAYLTPRLRGSALLVGLQAGLAIVVAGVLNGMLIGLFVNPPVGLILGLIFGVICSVPFLPALGLVVAAARRVGQARLESLLDEASRRGVWRATAVVLAGAAAMVATCTSHSTSDVFMAFPLLGVALVIALSFADLIAFARVRGLAALALVPRDEAEEAAAAPDGEPPIDLGMGDERLVELAPRGAVYRERARILHRVWGSVSTAHAALGRALAEDALALAFTLGSFYLVWLAIHAEHGPTPPFFGRFD